MEESGMNTKTGVNYIVKFFIPCALLLFWFVGALLFNNQISFSVLTYRHPTNAIRSSMVDQLYKGKKIAGSFTAKENHLGIVMLTFEHFVKPDFVGEDILAFRIREKGSPTWFYENSYRSGSLEHQLQYPFGFPVVEESKGKTYEFEIESLNGSARNAIQLNKRSPLLMTGYQFLKKDLMVSKKTLINFLLAKIGTSFTNPDFLLRSTLYLVPFIVYILAVIFYRQFIGVAAYVSYGLVTLMILDTVFLQEVYLGVILVINALWITCIYVRVITSKTSFSIAGFALLIALPAMVFGQSEMINKLCIWMYCMLVIGTLQAIVEEIIGTKKSSVMDSRDAHTSRKFNYESSTYLTELNRLPAEYHSRYVRTFEKYLPTKKALFLDTGCGNGFVLSELKKRGFSAGYGVDVSKLFVKAAAKKGLKNIHAYDGRKLPFRKQMFDVVGSFNVLEHTLEPDFFLLEELRVLKNGGYIIVGCPNFLTAIMNSPHPRIAGIVRKIKNIGLVMKKLVTHDYTFEKMPVIVREKFEYDDDAIVVTNILDISHMLIANGCTIEYESGFIQGDSPLHRVINSIPFVRYVLPSCFVVAQKK
jgi:SAM-dependent methyltransferase